MFKLPEKYQIKKTNTFAIPPIIQNRNIFAVASNGMDWEHVSVSVRDGNKSRMPNWDEMCHIKAVFWDDEDVVMQLHPKKSEYVNNHPHVLHLWRPMNEVIPTPPSIMVGIKGLELGLPNELNLEIHNE